MATTTNSFDKSLYNKLEDLGRRPLSRSFFMRDFLYSEIANVARKTNIPDDFDLACSNGQILCEQLLEPLQHAFGRIHLRSGYRSPDINGFGNARGDLNCSSNKENFGAHIWDHPHEKCGQGAMACVVVPSILKLESAQPMIWQELGCWIHDHLPLYKTVWFFSQLCAFNIGWSERGPKLIRKQGVMTLYDERKEKIEKFGVSKYPTLERLAAK